MIEKNVIKTRPLRVGIDGRMLQGNRRGDGRYVFELCQRLDKIFDNALFFVYSSCSVEMPVMSSRWILRSDKFPFSKLPPLVWLKLRGSFFCRKDKLDIFWGTNVFLPYLSGTVRKVVTVHDFCYQVVPENYNIAHLCSNRLFFMSDLNKADILLAASKGTAYRLKEKTGYLANIISPSVSGTFRPQSRIQIQTCLDSYGISYPYILNVAIWDPVKNLELLVKTFIGMKKQGLLARYKLVLVGQKGMKSKRLEKLVTDDKGEHIVWLGYVSDKHLPSLYAGAAVFVFPSIYEGFGMPPMEARACGTRVVATDIPELREAAGPDAVFIEPTERGISNGILTALKQEPANPITPAKVTWEHGAMILVAALRGELATAKEHDNQTS